MFSMDLFQEIILLVDFDNKSSCRAKVINMILTPYERKYKIMILCHLNSDHQKTSETLTKDRECKVGMPLS